MKPKTTRLRLELLESRSMLAAPPVFEQRGAGGGGALFAPSFSPFDANELYIASDMSQLFHTANLGQSWQTLTHLEIQGNARANVQFTEDPAIRYSLDYTSLLINAVTPSKSTDGGLTWTRMAPDPTGAGAQSLYADPADHNRLLVSDFTRLFFSGNAGASFGAAKYTTTDNSDGLHIAGAFFDGPNIYVGTSKGLLVSNNGGSTFAPSTVGGIPSDEAIVSFAGAKQGGVVRLFAVTMDAGDVYAGIPGSDYSGYQGVYSLDVGQANWALRTTGITAQTKPHFVALARNDINTAYVAGSNDSGTPTVFKTTNGGGSWQSVLLTTNNQNVATGWSGQSGDRGWTYGENAMGFAVAPLDANRLVITDFGFAHVSTNGGTSWSQMYVNPADQNPAGAQTPKGRNYRSSGLDNTTSWGITWVTPSILIGSNSDIRGVRSEDAGQSWSFDYTGHTDNSMYRAVVHPQTGIVYAGTSSVHDLYQSTRLADAILDPGTGKVLFSDDQGSTWEPMHDFANPVVWVALDPTDANRMYASVVDSTMGGIYVSNNIQDGDDSIWTRLATPPRSQGHPFNIQVLADGTLVATYSGRRDSNGDFTASSGVFVSTNGGASWSDRSDPGMYYWTKDIIVDPHDSTQNAWYVGVFSGWGGDPNGLGGLYRTTDRGQSWDKINNLDRVGSLTISPVNSNEAYLTTEEDGLWHTTNLNAATPSFTQLTQYPFRQPERVFFNPYNSSEIWVTSFGNGMRVGNTGAAATSSIVNRQLFYNNSAWDGNTLGVSTSDALAIATDKVAYLPGGGAMVNPGNAASPNSFKHVTSYSRGINGIFIDIQGPHAASLTAADFEFRINTGTNNSPSTWALAPNPSTITILPNTPAIGTDRIEIIWPNNSIRNNWLAVYVKANANTGLINNPGGKYGAGNGDLFFFGNRIGDAWVADSGSFSTGINDETATHVSGTGSATITNRFDFDRNKAVGVNDETLAHLSGGVLNYINIGIPPLAPPPAPPGGGDGDESGDAGISSALASVAGGSDPGAPRTALAAPRQATEETRRASPGTPPPLFVDEETAIPLAAEVSTDLLDLDDGLLDSLIAGLSL